MKTLLLHVVKHFLLSSRLSGAEVLGGKSQSEQSVLFLNLCIKAVFFLCLLLGNLLAALNQTKCGRVSFFCFRNFVLTGVPAELVIYQHHLSHPFILMATPAAL